MKEDFWQSLESYLTEEEQKVVRRKSAPENPQEKIRKQFEQRIGAEMDKYNQQYQEEAQVAKEKIAQVILPWYERDVIDSGLFTRLLQWKKGNRLPRLALTDPIIYPWPTKVMERLDPKNKLLSRAPFDIDAEFALEDVKKPIHVSIDEEIDNRVIQYFSETWKAEFFLASPIALNRHNLRIHYEPTRQPTGCGAKHIAHDMRLLFEGPHTILPSIHPHVINEFANQIENEQVWTKLEQSIRGRR